MRNRSFINVWCHFLPMLVLFGYSAGNAAVEAVPTPQSLAGGEIITIQQARDYFDRAAAVFIDTRSAINYGRGHIPKAVLAPYKGSSKKELEFDAALDQPGLDKLPADKSTRIIIYSHGDTGWKSYKTAVLAIRAGYSNVLWMREGFSRWQEQGYPVE